MTIRFAPARNRNTVGRAIGWGTIRSLRIGAANDNGAAEEQTGDQALLTATLRHFAAYGICAAEHARDRAITSRSAGDTDGCEHWLAICRMLNRRMAAATAARMDCIAD